MRITTGWPGALAFAIVAAPFAAQEHGSAPPSGQIEDLRRLQAGVDLLAPPRGVDVLAWKGMIPADNAPTKERIALGEKLYFDKRLSADDTVACATCHDTTRGFGDRRMASEGIGGQLGRRNAPTTMNVALMQPLFWDGRAATLEDQAKMPILNPIEMGMPDREAVVKKLEAVAEYRDGFAAAYGRPVNYDDLGRAIAAFERTLVFLDAPFDRHLAGDAKALSEDAKKGLVLYEGKARCASCHPLNAASPAGSDHLFHNIGVSARKQDFEKLAREALAALEKDSSEAALDKLALGTDLSELGRFMVTRNYADVGAFRTLGVRNLAVTAPYMHDGTLQTLWDVVDHYNKGGEANQFLDGGIEPLGLEETEVDHLVAFLFALTDRRFADQAAAQERKQREHAAKNRPFRDADVAMRRKIVFKLEAPPRGESR
jgi:cytochrome c peroxidase